MQTKILSLLLFFFLSIKIEAQVSVVNIQLQSYNISPEAMLSSTIMNDGNGQQIEIIAKLFNSNNELLLTVRSNPFNLKPGLNSSSDEIRVVAGIEYSATNQSNYINTTHTLPGGMFKICIDIMQPQTLESVDHFCDEIESELNQYMYLLYPIDKDSIECTTPLLMWTHNEPFNILSPNEYYRMVVTEINKDQNAEEAITTNTPMMLNNYLTSHSLQYPYDAKELQKGRHYAWQVQKISNGIIINKTEAWEFSIIQEKTPKDNKYATLKKVLDAGYYTTENNKLFFKFDEEYSSGSLSCNIYNSKRELILPKILNENNNRNILNFKQNGYNRYEIDLNKLDIEKGFYVMETKNEKGELFLLKFHVE